MVDGPRGPAVVMAQRLIVSHAQGLDCASCQDGWCPAAEWALWVTVTDEQPPPDRIPTIEWVRILAADPGRPDQQPYPLIVRASALRQPPSEADG
ncbi:hypothetical protein EF879_15060 [Micromonospora sp. HM5-17]|nr:hypothetical protein EF879_15060 [Micromonospora sp. HM5-17]